eukprot:15446621-Alexandrium_andersonii.AAC.1
MTRNSCLVRRTGSQSTVATVARSIWAPRTSRHRHTHNPETHAQSQRRRTHARAMHTRADARLETGNFSAAVRP